MLKVKAKTTTAAPAGRVATTAQYVDQTAAAQRPITFRIDDRQLRKKHGIQG